MGRRNAISPSEWFEDLGERVKTEYRTAFISAFVVGLLVHLPAFVMDVPNHDGLASIYFDQNMITSGRWFLTVACGISSYFTLPWLIGLVSLLWLSVTAVILIDILQVKSPIHVIIISGLLVAFPSLASTYAYIFTADGYMFGLMLSVLAVWFIKKYPDRGYIPGALCLCFSLGTYQAYLPMTIILAMYAVLSFYLEEDGIKKKLIYTIKALVMGVIGGGLYYLILKLMLKIQGVQLADYQGISSMASADSNLLELIKASYVDFAAFILKGGVLFNNLVSAIIFILLVIIWITVAFVIAKERYLFGEPLFYLVTLFCIASLPLVFNVIYFVSPEVNYHLIMRFQYALCIIIPLSMLMRRSEEYTSGGIVDVISQWVVIALGVIMVFNFAITDNIGYSNLQKKYEKTYSYCLRLADRIEQTPGYYTGMPVVLMGVVGDWNYPVTDVTKGVTDNMIGLNGDYLCYKPEDYKSFFANYLGITIEVVDQETVGEIYLNDKKYYELDSFPGEHCTEVVDGVLYVKTENALKLTGEKPQ